MADTPPEIPTVRTLTPILVVDAIEPCLDFWARLGFAVTVSVPNVQPFNFAILARDGLEVMLQTRVSVTEDTPGVEAGVGASVLYLGVGTIDAVLAVLGDAPVVVERRKTFYGADEIFVRDPAGNVIGFSAPA